MAESETLHERLIARQTDDELERKWRKAEGRWSNSYWAAEWIDVAKRRAKRWVEYFGNGGMTRMKFFALQLLGMAIAFAPTPHEWEGLFGYVAGSLMIYAMAARRIGGWWL